MSNYHQGHKGTRGMPTTPTKVLYDARYARVCGRLKVKTMTSGEEYQFRRRCDERLLNHSKFYTKKETEPKEGCY